MKKKSSQKKPAASNRVGSKAMVRRIFEIIERRGALPYLVRWQTLDGRLQEAYYSDGESAAARRGWLTSLGRTAKVYVEVDLGEDYEPTEVHAHGESPL